MKQLEELGVQGKMEEQSEATGTENSLEWLETQQQMQYCYLSSCLGKLAGQIYA